MIRRLTFIVIVCSVLPVTGAWAQAPLYPENDIHFSEGVDPKQVFSWLPWRDGRLWDYRKDHHNRFSIQEDIQIGLQAIRELKHNARRKGIPVNPAYLQALKNQIDRIVSRIGSVSDHPEFPFHANLFHVDIANAACLPGGQMIVYSGIFNTEKGLIDLQDENELAAVLAHEIAHATLRHATRSMTTSRYLNLAATVGLLVIGGKFGLAPMMLANLGISAGEILVAPSYSRKHEREADRTGLYYMAKAGFDPRGAVDVWSRAAEQGGANADKTHFFASHPADGERVENLEEWIEDALLVYRGQPRIKP